MKLFTDKEHCMQQPNDMILYEVHEDEEKFELDAAPFEIGQQSEI